MNKANFLAQIGGVQNTSLSIYSIGMSIANAVWIVFTIIAILCFVFAGIMFLTAFGDAAKTKTARDAFVWGVVGIVVAILAFSIVAIVRNTLGA